MEWELVREEAASRPKVRYLMVTATKHPCKVNVANAFGKKKKPTASLVFIHHKVEENLPYLLGEKKSLKTGDNGK